MPAAVVLYNRDLRVRDHPALAEAAKAERVVPLFVVDPRIIRSPFCTPNRAAFLVEALSDLRDGLRSKGADLVVRSGDPVDVAIGVAREVGAETIVATEDVSRFAKARQDRLCAAAREARIGVRFCPGIGVVAPGAVRPSSGDHFKVFTPYFRAWSRTRWRPPVARLPALSLPDGLEPGPLPTVSDLARGERSPGLPPGGEEAGRRALRRWIEGGLAAYPDGNDDLGADGTSRLSPYLHFGCLSSLEVASAAAERPGGEGFVRQLCWRDFYHQVHDAFPGLATEDYRPRGDRWSHDADSFGAWAEGRTGYPIVDAGMRQLREEGWMHNRARLITASFLVKDLYLDWRAGARQFFDWLVDGDIAQNSANWQWVAGTGNDTRPNRVFNPLRQAERFDPDGTYVRRFVPELAELDAASIHQPWKLPARLRPGGYPEPIVDHDRAAAAFRARRTETDGRSRS